MKSAIQRKGIVPVHCLILIFVLLAMPASGWALASNNVPLDSPVYDYLDKLASFGLITSDFKGIRPSTKAEAARLLLEAEKKRAPEVENATQGGGKEYVTTVKHYPPLNNDRVGGALVDEAIGELRRLLKREIALRDKPESAPPLDAAPLSELKLRYVYLDGAPRSYERQVHDPGNEGVFGIGSGLRPRNPYPSPVNQHGSEGTPLLENNEGVTYARGSNIDLRFSSEAFLGTYATALVEPMFLYEEHNGLTQLRLNKGYAKLGGGGVELEVGRDANWLGLGERGAVTLTNNAVNFDQIKLSSPEPIKIRYLGNLKYSLIFSRFDSAGSGDQERHPYFMAAKISIKPLPNLEIGLNMGKQFGGTGVKNGLNDNIHGIFGGTSSDNTNNLGGIELRYRMPFLRNTEIYGEFSGEDSAGFWPIVESYVAGIYIPRLTEDGRNDFRFEFFLGNNILYTNGTFPEGYIYKGMPIGHSQGGATQDFFFRFRHWFAARHNATLEYFYTERGNAGRMQGQTLERKNAVRAVWNYPLSDRIDMGLMYGCEQIDNVNLVGGVDRNNQLGRIDLTYRY